jgi:hypothetical protein
VTEHTTKDSTERRPADRQPDEGQPPLASTGVVSDDEAQHRRLYELFQVLFRRKPAQGTEQRSGNP